MIGPRSMGLTLFDIAIANNAIIATIIPETSPMPIVETNCLLIFGIYIYLTYGPHAVDGFWKYNGIDQCSFGTNVIFCGITNGCDFVHGFVIGSWPYK